MASYYYLISSLPTLKTDAPMPFSYDEFLSMCVNAVNNNVFYYLKNLSLTSENGPLVRQWGIFYNHLMKSLEKVRTLKLGKPFNENVDKDELIDKAVEAAMSADNPLIAEKILLKCQFDYLDSLVAMHSFDDYVLFGYAVKLKLLERQTVFDNENGKEEFKRLFENIQQQILST